MPHARTRSLTPILFVLALVLWTSLGPSSVLGATVDRAMTCLIAAYVVSLVWLRG